MRERWLLSVPALAQPPLTERVVRHLDMPISVTLPSATTLDLLNAITKSHGRLGWSIEYAHAPADFRYSCILLTTFDGKFAGIGATACAGY